MTDNDLRKSRHWRCSQCGSSWPLDMAVCGNPACGAELGIYGQVIEPEPEKPPEPEKKPPSPEDEKPKDEQKKEPKREKPDRAAQKREAREAKKRQKAEAKSRRRAEREGGFTGGDYTRVSHKLMLPLLIAVPVLVCVLNNAAVRFAMAHWIQRWYIVEGAFAAIFVITLVCAAVSVLRGEGAGGLMRALPRPLITGVVLAGISWFGFRNWEVVLGVFSICSSTALVISAACLRWQREGRFAGRGKCVTMAVVTAVLALGSTLLVLLMSEEYCGNIIPKILLYVFPSAAGAACAYVIFLVTRRDRIAPVLLLLNLLASHLYLWAAYNCAAIYLFR